MMEPIGNLEHWTYIDRPDYFAALADEGMDELDKMLAILRWLCTYPVLADHCMTGLTSLYVVTKEVKFVRHPIAKPFNSVLVWIVSPLPLGMRVSVDRLLSLAGRIIPLLLRHPVLELHPKKKHPLPAIHVDEDPHPEIITCAGRGSNNTTSAAPLKSLPPSPLSTTLVQPTRRTVPPAQQQQQQQQSHRRAGTWPRQRLRLARTCRAGRPHRLWHLPLPVQVAADRHGTLGGTPESSSSTSRLRTIPRSPTLSPRLA